jgi:NAD(P)H-nitrite reductase large subunit
MLSYLVAGKITEDRLYFRPKTFYEDYSVTPILGKKVVGIDSRAKIAVLDSGEKVPYDKLLVGTGRSSGRLNIEGYDGPGVFGLVTYADALGILGRLPQVRQVVVIGSGLIGLKAAEALAVAGKEVSVVEIGPHVLPLAVDARAAEILSGVLAENGVDLYPANSVSEIRRDAQEEIIGCLLADGTELKAQMVISAAGLHPNLDFLVPTLARVGTGVIVDHFLETTEPGIYAAGDVSESRDIITGRSNLSAVWPRASEQGYCAGYNMAGFPKEYDGGYGMNSVAFFGLSCITIGDVLTEKEAHEILVREIPDEGIYFKVILEDDMVRGVVQVGRILNVSAMNRLIRKRVNVGSFKDYLLEEKFVFAY